jgi:S1-C subfamily serine protease
LEQLVEFGQVSRGLLGVSINNLTPETAELYGLDHTAGALVSAISADSAAERAGIQINDIIVSVNDHRVRDPAALRNAIGLLRPGSGVRIGVIRDGRERAITAVLGEAPAAARAAAPPPADPAEDLDPVFAGATLADTESGAATAGVLVARVEPESEAWQLGLRAGDLITHVNRVRVRNLAEATELIGNARSIVLQIQRGNRNQLLLMR